MESPNTYVSVHMNMTSKRIERESPSESGFDATLSVFKTRATGTYLLNPLRSYFRMKTDPFVRVLRSFDLDGIKTDS